MDRGCTVWLTGLSGAGKTTTAMTVRDTLLATGRAAVVIDGDDLRRGLSADLGFSAADRDENIRRAGEIALMMNRQGVVAIVSLISPRAVARGQVRSRHSSENLAFVEVYLATPIEICEQRDIKALYQRARGGEAIHLTGVDDPYEAPESPEMTLSTEVSSSDEVARAIISLITS